MRTLTEALDQLAYHPGTPDTAARHAAVRATLSGVAGELWELVPDGPEKTLAMRALQQAGMYCNLAIALTVPADLDTPHVARVMP